MVTLSTEKTLCCSCIRLENNTETTISASFTRISLSYPLECDMETTILESFSLIS